jgi:hypothetical protein
LSDLLGSFLLSDRLCNFVSDLNTKVLDGRKQAIVLALGDRTEFCFERFDKRLNAPL